MSVMASKITCLTIVYSTVYSRRRSKKTSKLRVTGLCLGNSPVTGEFPSQMDSNAENVSIWWRHHDNLAILCSDEGPAPGPACQRWTPRSPRHWPHPYHRIDLTQRNRKRWSRPTHLQQYDCPTIVRPWGPRRSSARASAALGSWQSQTEASPNAVYTRAAEWTGAMLR